MHAAGCSPAIGPHQATLVDERLHPEEQLAASRAVKSGFCAVQELGVEPGSLTPPAPQPLTPEQAERLDAEVRFCWLPLHISLEAVALPLSVCPDTKSAASLLQVQLGTF